VSALIIQRPELALEGFSHSRTVFLARSRSLLSSEQILVLLFDYLLCPHLLLIALTVAFLLLCPR
jgi:hypothetical protein